MSANRFALAPAGLGGSAPAGGGVSTAAMGGVALGAAAGVGLGAGAGVGVGAGAGAGAVVVGAFFDTVSAGLGGGLEVSSSTTAADFDIFVDVTLVVPTAGASS